jgi:hypothetical protein
MTRARGSDVITNWPEESREAAQLVIDEHGEPYEATDSTLIWHNAGPWKRIASRQHYEHNFPARHIDAVESLIDYWVPVEKFSPLAKFDGSVVVERTAGEVSARCHDRGSASSALRAEGPQTNGRVATEATGVRRP